MVNTSYGRGRFGRPAKDDSVEINPKERGLGKPCAGKPPARFDEGESRDAGNRLAALSTLLQCLDGSLAGLGGSGKSKSLANPASARLG
jgi:hypothetical protein